MHSKFLLTMFLSLLFAAHVDASGGQTSLQQVLTGGFGEHASWLAEHPNLYKGAVVIYFAYQAATKAGYDIPATLGFKKKHGPSIEQRVQDLEKRDPSVGVDLSEFAKREDLNNYATKAWVEGQDYVNGQQLESLKELQCQTESRLADAGYLTKAAADGLYQPIVKE